MNDERVKGISYARARLWLGMSGVGAIVVASVIALLLDLPTRLLPTATNVSWADAESIVAIVVGITAVMIPIDFLGGFYLPTRFGRTAISAPKYFGSWVSGVIVQGVLFAISFAAILAAGRIGGLGGAIVAISAMMIMYVSFQGHLVRLMTGGHYEVSDDKVERAARRAVGWGLRPRPVEVVHAADPGFNGGIVGLPHFETVVLPRNFVDRLTVNQLSVVLARRMVAIDSGGRTRGILLAVGWILAGFGLSSLLPGAGVTSVAELMTTCLGFTLWTFLGLLTLPTVSRQASYAIDCEVVRRGAEPGTLTETISMLDTWQDDEPSRGALIETVFHPVPSVSNRKHMSESGSPWAWHAARMTLFLSWSCMGLLSRAVHCNAGRPELWAMLPAD
ncbi:MAG: hypothetical protein ACPGLY_27250 [Rubripirellula sp.]